MRLASESEQVGESAAAEAAPPARQVRSIWVSDVHMGTKSCQADRLDSFLDSYKFKYLYLVGDIVDGWALRKSWHWDGAHNDLVRRILQIARQGTEVRLLCGNHDEFLRAWIGQNLGGIQIEEEAEHRTADGRRLLVFHGDRFDAVVRGALWLSHLGDWAYRLLLVVNSGLNVLRRLLGLPKWSLALFLKRKVKSALSYVKSFEDAIAHETKRRGFDGVVCGHIHKPECREIDGIQYHNSGDWVDSCTAIIEDLDGRMRLARWPADSARDLPHLGTFQSATARS